MSAQAPGQAAAGRSRMTVLELALLPGQAREWCECGAGLFILVRDPGGERHFECGACGSAVTGG